ncbi:MAG: sulfatase-like hydrolase/transferase, partial [Bacteroidota bacterium]
GTCDRAPAPPPVTTKQTPNILWLTCEDISPLLPMFGDSTIETPNLSRLAARGVRFPNTFSVAGVCAPSRHAIVTGMYPISTGGHNMRTQGGGAILSQVGLQSYGAVPPPEVKMMSQLLRENGYFCSNNQKTDYQFAPLKTGWDDLGPKAHWRHRTDPNQPFFSIFNMEVTHESQIWQTSKGNLRFRPGMETDTATVYKWRDVLKGDDRPPLTVPADRELPLPPYLVDDEASRTDMRRVYSNIKIMDEQVGFLLDQLEEDGLLDNTIIFFYSDHGGPLPRQKRLLYDSGLRVPLIVAWPDDRRAGAIDSSLFSFVDLAPTVFSLTDIPLPDYLQGQAILGPAAAPPRDYVFAASDRLDEHYDRIRAARDHRYKYLRNYYPERAYYLPVAYREQIPAMQSLLKGRDAGTLTDAQAQWFRKTKPTEELFDTWEDPHELHNLAGDPRYADKLAELRTAMDEWLARVGDLGAVPEIELVGRFWNGGEEMPVTGRPQLRRDSLGRFLLESKTPGAQIAYQLTAPGEEPGAWLVYTGPIEYNGRDTLKTVAQRIGYRESGVSLGY